MLFTVPSTGGLLRKIGPHIYLSFIISQSSGHIVSPPFPFSRMWEVSMNGQYPSPPPPPTPSPQSPKAKREFSSFCSNKTKNRCTRTVYQCCAWIRDILVRIRGSVPLTYGSGSCSFRQGTFKFFCPIFKVKKNNEVTKH
jgi:hypothetical protein